MGYLWLVWDFTFYWGKLNVDISENTVHLNKKIVSENNIYIFYAHLFVKQMIKLQYFLILIQKPRKQMTTSSASSTR